MEMINLNILQLLLPVVRERSDPQLRRCSSTRSRSQEEHLWSGANACGSWCNLLPQMLPMLPPPLDLYKKCASFYLAATGVRLHGLTPQLPSSETPNAQLQKRGPAKNAGKQIAYGSHGSLGILPAPWLLLDFLFFFFRQRLSKLHTKLF